MKDDFLMTSHKLHWHLDRVNDWLQGNTIIPIHIELGLTSSCNLRCYFCFGKYSGQDNTNFNMPKDKLLELLKDAKDVGIRSITLASEGENTLHPNFYEILDYAREIGLDMALLTNGTVIKHDKIENFLKSLTYVRFSISASNPESYKLIQGRDMFDRVIDNITKCVEVRNKLNLDTVIGTMMVLTDRNIEDVVPLAKISRELGVDYFVVKPCSDDSDRIINVDVDKYLEEETNKALKEAESYATENFDVIIKYDKLGNKGINSFEKCHGTNFSIAINSHGNVAPCGSLQGYRKDEFCIGNILETRFRDLVKSDRYKEVQKKVLTLDVNKECETNCLQHAMNIYLDKLKHPPKHINFP